MFPPAQSESWATFWLTDIRKIALLAFITFALSLLRPMWVTAQRTIDFGSTGALPWWAMLPSLFALLLSATLPAFYFALFKTEGTLRVHRRFRPLALGGILSLGLYVALSLPATAEYLGAAGSSMGGTISGVSVVVSQLSNLASILLLLALFRQAGDELPVDFPVPRLLSSATKLAVMASGLWSAFSALRLVLSPLSYSQLRDYAARVGRTPPSFWEIAGEAIRALLSAIGLLAAPYIVYRSQTRTNKSSVPS